MADEKLVFGLDLDSKDFVKGIGEAKNSLKEMAEAKSLDSLAASFLEFTPLIAGIGVALFALKKTFDFAEEAEKLRLVEKQFESLSESIGISADVLKNDLIKSAQGLVSTDDLINIANKSFLKLGDNIKRLPEIIDIANKATRIYGGTTEEVTNAIVQGVSSGNARMLKQYGIIVDTDKAYKEYAKSIGVTVGQLNEQGKQQAFLNAALDQAATKYKTVNVESAGIQNAATRAKVAWTEAFEAFIGWFSKTEPFWKRTLDNLSEYGNMVRKVFSKDAKDDLEGHQEKLNELQAKWVELDQAADRLKSRKSEDGSVSDAILDREIAKRLQARDAIMEQINAQNALITEKSKEITPQEEKKQEQKTEAKGVDYEKKRQDEAKFNADVLSMRAERAAKEQDMALTAEQADKIMTERKSIMEQEYYNQVEQIKANQNLTDQQRNEMIYQSKLDLNQKLAQLEDERDKNHAKAEDNMVRKSKTASDGMGSAFNQMSRKNERDLKNWGHTGQIVANSFANNMTSAIQAWADGSKSASEAIKGFMFGLIADTAEAKGREMLLAGIYPPNPPAIYGGVGLIALSAVLRAKAGGSKGGGIGDTGGGGGGTPSSSINIPETPQLEKPEVEAAKKRSVTVNIQGNVLGNSEFQREIVEMIRREGDATDFKYFQVQG